MGNIISQIEESISDIGIDLTKAIEDIIVFFDNIISIFGDIYNIIEDIGEYFILLLFSTPFFIYMSSSIYLITLLI